jgi:hypothetical protein
LTVWLQFRLEGSNTWLGIFSLNTLHAHTEAKHTASKSHQFKPHFCVAPGWHCFTSVCANCAVDWLFGWLAGWLTAGPRPRQAKRAVACTTLVSRRPRKTDNQTQEWGLLLAGWLAGWLTLHPLPPCCSTHDTTPPHAHTLSATQHHLSGGCRSDTGRVCLCSVSSTCNTLRTCRYKVTKTDAQHTQQTNQAHQTHRGVAPGRPLWFTLSCPPLCVLLFDWAPTSLSRSTALRALAHSCFG